MFKKAMLKKAMLESTALKTTILESTMINSYFIGIDVGGTKIYGGLVNANGEILSHLKLATPPNAAPATIIALIIKIARDLAKTAHLPFRNIRALGIAIPGIVDNNGKVVITPNIRLSGTDLKKILHKKLRITVCIGNDVNLGVLGECWLGAGRKAKNIIGIFPGTGVGGGIVINNEFLSGTQGAAAELGHMQIDPNGPLCTCGNKGCLEAFAGRWAIEKAIREGLAKNRRSIITTLAGKNPKQIKSGMLAKALIAKDPLICEVIARAVNALAHGCISLNHIFNSDIFLFGGGVIEACGDFILPSIEKALKNDPFFKRLKTPRVVRAKLGDDAVMLGAVAMAKRSLGEKIDGKYRIYPVLKYMGPNRLYAGKDKFEGIFYVRADGKIKQPKDLLVTKISENDLEEMCRKSPDILIIAQGKAHTAITPKGLKFLKKKNITLRTLPARQAVALFNSLDERKMFLSFP